LISVPAAVGKSTLARSLAHEIAAARRQVLCVPLRHRRHLGDLREPFLTPSVLLLAPFFFATIWLFGINEHYWRMVLMSLQIEGITHKPSPICY
jgi:hypothetical protein